MKLIDYKFTAFAGANTLIQGAMFVADYANGVKGNFVSLGLLELAIVGTILVSKLEADVAKTKAEEVQRN